MYVLFDSPGLDYKFSGTGIDPWLALFAGAVLKDHPDTKPDESTGEGSMALDAARMRLNLTEALLDYRHITRVIYMLRKSEDPEKAQDGRFDHLLTEDPLTRVVEAAERLEREEGTHLVATFSF